MAASNTRALRNLSPLSLRNTACSSLIPFESLSAAAPIFFFSSSRVGSTNLSFRAGAPVLEASEKDTVMLFDLRGGGRVRAEEVVFLPLSEERATVEEVSPDLDGADFSSSPFSHAFKSSSAFCFSLSFNCWIALLFFFSRSHCVCMLIFCVAFLSALRCSFASCISFSCLATDAFRRASVSSFPFG